MAFDPASGTVVMFGGQGRSGSLSDTWTWDGSVWTEAHPSTSPPPLSGAKMAYDPVSHDLVLIGGQRIHGSPFDGGVACSAAGSSGSASGSASGRATFVPPSAASPAIAPVPDESGSVTTSKAEPSCRIDDTENTATWLWDGSNWTKASGTTPEVAFGDWSLATDPVSSRVMLFAAEPFIAEPDAAAAAPAIACPIQANGDTHVIHPACPVYPVAEPTWTWNGHAWTAGKIPANGRYLPEGALGSTIVDDPVTGRLAVFSSDLVAAPITCGPGAICANSGSATSVACCGGAVSVWDGSGWKQTATFKNGPLITSGTLVGDPASHGDLYLTAEGQTWLWTGVWTREHPAHTPSALTGTAAAYDASSGQVVLFGGLSYGSRASGLYDQTWTWDGSGWTMRGGSAGPSVSVPVPTPVIVPPLPGCTMPPLGKPVPEPAIACPMIPAGGGVSGSSGATAGSAGVSGSGAAAG